MLPPDHAKYMQLQLPSRKGLRIYLHATNNKLGRLAMCRKIAIGFNHIFQCQPHFLKTLFNSGDECASTSKLFLGLGHLIPGK